MMTSSSFLFIISDMNNNFDTGHQNVDNYREKEKVIDNFRQKTYNLSNRAKRKGQKAS